MSRVRAKEIAVASRKRAARTRERPQGSVGRMSAKAAQRLVHELEVHQVELPMQNETLLNAQADLAHARDRFADLYDFAPIAYLTLDTSGLICEANLTAAALLGVARKQLVGERFERFVVSEQHRPYHRYQRLVLSSATAQGCDVTMRRRDGSTFAARLEAKRIDDLATCAPSWRCVISDITERIDAQEALRARAAEVGRLNTELGRPVDERTAQLEEQRVRLQAIVDTVAEGIITFDQHGVIDSINAAALQIFGYAERDALGKPLERLVLGSTGMIEGAGGRRIEASATSMRAVTGRHRAGHLIPVELSVSEMRLPQARRFVAVVRDVSDKRRLETQLRERQEDAAQLHRLRTAGELAGVLAHQLNQPLTAILGFAEAAAGHMRRGACDPDDMSTTLTEIVEQAHRAAQVIRDLRQFLSRERGEMVPADLNATAHRAFELMYFPANDAGVTLMLDLGKTMPLVPMLKSQIEQVLVILVDNALDAIRDQRDDSDAAALRPATISLGTSFAESEGAVVVTVRDTGPGLDLAHAQRVFDPLYTTKVDGVGLGLSIARSVIEAHGGRIWAEPGAQGLFHFMLPVRQ